MAFETGRIHDIGKYSKAFQDKLLNNSNLKFEHSTCGAIEIGKLTCNHIEKNLLPMIQYCIVGHHSGLPDGGTKISLAEEGTLCGRLKREKNYIGDSDYSSYKNEICLEFPDVKELYEELEKAGKKDLNDLIEKYAFFTRYLFSCLTDADYLDTEKFCTPEITRELKVDFDSVITVLEQKMKNFIPDTELQKARSRIQEQAYKRSESSEKISILNMPTGSGKTLCSLNIALEKVKHKEKKRIIYVIPYTSIIEQTAEIFNSIFGKHISIIQHHSNFSFDENFYEDTTSEKIKRSTENWDAPIIITTNVQFFESLYHFKGSRLRKMHNLADAILIFDEIHMLPIKYLQPCIRGIGYITKFLNSEAIFLSATMPDYSKLFKQYIPDCLYTELIQDKSEFKYFKKCTFHNLGKTDYDAIIDKSLNYKSNLIIVNKRKTAKEIYSKLTGNKFHLSTFMTPKDRSIVIGNIKKCLEEKISVTVVSTSLIEAGVDLDFETVFREISGLDSIIQSGGRCNREGSRKNGDVYIFDTDNNEIKDLKIKISIMRDILNTYSDITSDEAIHEYYDRLFSFKEDIIEENTIAKNVRDFYQIPFRSYSKSFEFIASETISIVINNCFETNQSLQLIKYGHISEKRNLQKYSVSLRKETEFDKANSLGLISDTGYGIFILADNNYYNSETGLNLDMTNDQII